MDVAQIAAAMRMGNNGDMSGGGQGNSGPQQQGGQASGPEQALRMHQAEALLRSHTEAALRLAVSAPCFRFDLQSSNQNWLFGNSTKVTYPSSKIIDLRS